MFSFEDPIESIPGIGPKRIEQLARLEIITIGDLLYYVPFRYEDLTEQTRVADVVAGERVVLSGEILSVSSVRTRSGKTMQKGLFTDGDDTIGIVWFNQPFLVQNFRKHPRVLLSGKAKLQSGALTLQSPQYELINADALAGLDSDPGGLFPVYPLTGGITNKWLRAKIRYALKAVTVVDWMPKEILDSNELISLSHALNQIHMPSSLPELKKARHRLAFDELFLLQLRAQRYRQAWQHKTNAYQIAHTDADIARYKAALPFELTGAQARVIGEILDDLHADVPMNRLLQGDVGSGKTAVAAAALWMCYRAGLPSVVMAPTEILADQHARSLAHLLEPLGVHISRQTRSKHDSVESASVIVGTHAVLFRAMPKNIGLVVIDEQHRFGVSQRAALMEQEITPNVLSMTATPIPRTIALSLYADLDMSVIDEMPAGREPVTTWVLPEKKRSGSYEWIRQQILESEAQVFVVCPFIEKSDAPSLAHVASAKEMYDELNSKIFPDISVGLVHGGMTTSQKDAAILDFSKGVAKILVATPVIEVGIDIPQATIMVIEAADRFGLAALHQLRGRVGRGGTKSYCLLYSSTGKPNQRLAHMELVHSGLQLAQLDMELRGAGELYGTRQSGYINLKIATLQDTMLIHAAHEAVESLLTKDASLRSWPYLYETFEALLAKTLADN